MGKTPISGVCALCLQHRRLCKSHYLGKAIHRLMNRESPGGQIVFTPLPRSAASFAMVHDHPHYADARLPAAKLHLDQTTNTSCTCYGGVGHDGALSQEITARPRTQTAPGQML
jgi:hypothetical protein